MAYSTTARGLRLLRYLTGYIEAKGRAPTFDEMAQGAGLTHKSKAHGIFSRLEERGHVRSRADHARSAQVILPVSIPRAPDGAPLFVVPGFGIGGE